MTVQFTTQLVSTAAVALAMITAGIGKGRLEWRRRPPKRRKRG